MNDFYPTRPNAERLRCACCGRVFAAGHIPGPEVSGPYMGRLLCRDCREVLDAPPDAHPTLI